MSPLPPKARLWMGIGAACALLFRRGVPRRQVGRLGALSFGCLAAPRSGYRFPLGPESCSPIWADSSERHFVRASGGGGLGFAIGHFHATPWHCRNCSTRAFRHPKPETLPRPLRRRCCASSSGLLCCSLQPALSSHLVGEGVGGGESDINQHSALHDSWLHGLVRSWHAASSSPGKRYRDAWPCLAQCRPLFCLGVEPWDR